MLRKKIIVILSANSQNQRYDDQGGKRTEKSNSSYAIYMLIAKGSVRIRREYFDSGDITQRNV